LCAAGAPAASANASTAASRRPNGVNPVVLFPAYTYNRLQSMRGQRTDPACPSSGRFEILPATTAPSAFSSVCRDELLTLRYNPDRGVRFAQRFSEQPGVTTSIPGYGSTRSAPFYEPLYTTLEKADTSGTAPSEWPAMTSGWRRTRRLPAADRPTDRADLACQCDRPVQLVGHSNGPLYISTC